MPGVGQPLSEITRPSDTLLLLEFSVVVRVVFQFGPETLVMVASVVGKVLKPRSPTTRSRVHSAFSSSSDRSKSTMAPGRGKRPVGGAGVLLKALGEV